VRWLIALLALAGLLCGAPPAAAQANQHHRAIIFVHGFEGSGAQFESQKMRFASNGYPGRYVGVLEYDSSPATPIPGTSGLNPTGIELIEQGLFPRLDRRIAHMKAVTHRGKVDLAAHSLGTKLMQDYLKSSRRRARNVAHYVNIDGQTANAPPGGVRTLALWADRGPLSPPGRRIKGAENVTIRNTTHVQCATSPRSFRWMYRFFNGERPATTRIVPQSGRITLAGRAVNFPQNSGLQGATVEVWRINQATGQRAGTHPIASLTPDSSGHWGPVRVRSGRRYEFALLRPGAPVHHFYYEPFLRADHLIRLLESDALRSAGGPPDPRSVAMVIIRYKELWGDQGSHSDVLTVNRHRVCNPDTCPLSKEVNALFVADFNHDGMSEPHQTWPGYSNLGFFVSSSDAYVPAQTPPTHKVTIGIKSRGKAPARTLTFPNFQGTTDVVTVQLNDFDQR
jgi:hypothetical protein